MKYNAVLFDFDLTLVDSSKPILTCFETVLKEFGYPPKSKVEIFNTIGMDLTKALKLLSGECNDNIVEKIRKRYVEVADEVMVKGTVFYDGALELLKTLRENGVKYGIVSSKFGYRVMGSFEVYNCMELMPDVIVGRDNVTVPKPDATGISIAMQKLKVTNKEALYVGDSYIDAMTSQNAGTDFAAVLTGSTTKETFAQYNCIAVCDSVKELASIILNNV